MHPALTNRIAVVLTGTVVFLCPFVFSSGLRQSAKLILKIIYLYVATGASG